MSNNPGRKVKRRLTQQMDRARRRRYVAQTTPDDRRAHREAQRILSADPERYESFEEALDAVEDGSAFEPEPTEAEEWQALLTAASTSPSAAGVVKATEL